MGHPAVRGRWPTGRAGHRAVSNAVSLPVDAVDNQRFAVCVAHEAGRCSEDLDRYSPGRVALVIAGQIIKVDFAGASSVMHEREDKQAVGAGRDADPFVGDGVIARPDRVDADHFAPRAFILPSPILIGLLSWSSATPNRHEQSWCGPSRAGRIPRTRRPSCRCQRRPCLPNRTRHARHS